MPPGAPAAPDSEGPPTREGTLSVKADLGSRLSDLRRAIARLKPRQKAVVGLMSILVVLTWLAACALLSSLFI